MASTTRVLFALSVNDARPMRSATYVVRIDYLKHQYSVKKDYLKHQYCETMTQLSPFLLAMISKLAG